MALVGEADCGCDFRKGQRRFDQQPPRFCKATLEHEGMRGHAFGDLERPGEMTLRQACKGCECCDAELSLKVHFDIFANSPQSGWRQAKMGIGASRTVTGQQG